MQLSSRWHLDVVGKAAPAGKIDRYGSKNTALWHASAVLHGSSDLHHNIQIHIITITIIIINNDIIHEWVKNEPFGLQPKLSL
jgi:hypothetical protein